MKCSLSSILLIGTTALAVIASPYEKAGNFNENNEVIAKRDGHGGSRGGYGRGYGRGRYGRGYGRGRYYRNGRYWDYGYGPDFVAIGVDGDFDGGDLIGVEAIGVNKGYEPDFGVGAAGSRARFRPAGGFDGFTGDKKTTTEKPPVKPSTTEKPPVKPTTTEKPPVKPSTT
ncbi:hypothetical protein AYI68_g609, partial [Smittium mucronatum]